MDGNLTKFDDETLLHRIREGRHDAFSALVCRHVKRFYSIAYRILNNKVEAEDIVQEAFLKLWEKPELWDETRQVKFTTWFYRVVTNLCLDHNKKKKPVRLPEDLPIIDGKPNGIELLEQRQKQAMLEKFIRELPERQQLALNLCFYEGLSNKEAAEIIDIKVKALQSLIMRAKITLKEKINRYWPRERTKG
jgi:RNA polymerase sigma-70 factor (ECF subfamily)